MTLTIDGVTGKYQPEYHHRGSKETNRREMTVSRINDSEPDTKQRSHREIWRGSAIGRDRQSECD